MSNNTPPHDGGSAPRVPDFSETARPSVSTCPLRLSLSSRIFLRLIELTPQIRAMRREIAATEDMLLAVDDTIKLVDAAEARHAGQWPPLDRTEAGKALVNLRKESLEVAANLRGKIADLIAYKPVPTFARPDLAHCYLRSIYTLLDVAEAEIIAERGR